MENLIRELIEKHKLGKKEAANAVQLVVNYLKNKNPALEKLIDHELTKHYPGGENGTDQVGT